MQDLVFNGCHGNCCNRIIPSPVSFFECWTFADHTLTNLRNRRDYLHAFQAGDPIDCFKHVVPQLESRCSSSNICAQRKALLITKQRSLKLKSNVVLGAAVNTHEVTFWFGKLAQAEFFLFSIDFNFHSHSIHIFIRMQDDIHTKMMKVCIALHCFALYCIDICQMYIYIILHPEELRYSYHFGSGWQRLAILWRLWTPMRARVSTTSCRVLRHFIGAWVFRAANSEVLPRKGPEMVAGVFLAGYLYPEVN